MANSATQRSQPTLAITRPLLNWLRSDLGWRKLPLQQRAVLNWQSTWGSINAQLTRRLESQRGPSTPLADPVLVAGLWRSGTTVMHELLTAATGLPTPRSWQCMNAAAFTTTPRRANHQVLARPMDALPIGDESPQEDEFALLTLGAPSAYRAFWQPGRLAELTETLDPDFWLRDSSWLITLEGFLRDVLSTAATSAGPLILKSPNHSFRLRALYRRFPGLRVVWMARPAAQVFMSNRKMWQTMFAIHGLPGSGVDPLALDQFLAHAMHRAADVLLWGVKTMPSTQWLTVAHTALQAAPERVVLDARDQLGLPAAASPAQMQHALSLTRQGRVERHVADELPALALEACRRLDQAQAVALHTD